MTFFKSSKKRKQEKQEAQQQQQSAAPVATAAAPAGAQPSRQPQAVAPIQGQPQLQSQQQQPSKEIYSRLDPHTRHKHYGGRKSAESSARLEGSQPFLHHDRSQRFFDPLIREQYTGRQIGSGASGFAAFDALPDPFRERGYPRETNIVGQGVVVEPFAAFNTRPPASVARALEAQDEKGIEAATERAISQRTAFNPHLKVLGFQRGRDALASDGVWEEHPQEQAKAAAPRWTKPVALPAMAARDRAKAWAQYHAMMERHQEQFVNPVMTEVSYELARAAEERASAWEAYHDMMRRHTLTFVNPVMKTVRDEERVMRRDARRAESWRLYHDMMQRHKEQFVDPVMAEVHGEMAHQDNRAAGWREHHGMMERHAQHFVKPTMTEAKSAGGGRMRANAWNEYHGMMQRHKEQFVDPVMSDVLLAQREATIGADKQTGLAVRNPVRLFDGGVIPQLGFGTWQAEPLEVSKAVEQAIRAGFRHIDTAAQYGNEGAVGAAINRCIRAGIVKREELFITTKLWNTNHEPSQVRGACEASLRRLGLKYVDLFLMHYPVAFKNTATDFDDMSDAVQFPKNKAGGADVLSVPVERTWSAMEGLVKAGLSRYIGVSNFSVKELMDIVKIAKIPIAVHQVELHPGLPQKSLRMFHTRHHIVTEAYSPLGIGAGNVEHSLIKHPYIAGLAEAYEMSAAEMLLRWNLSEGNVVLSKSTNDQHIRENAKLSSDPLPLDLLRTLNVFGIEYPLRALNPTFFRAKRNTKFFLDGRPEQYEADASDKLEKLHDQFVRDRAFAQRALHRSIMHTNRRQRLLDAWSRRVEWDRKHKRVGGNRPKAPASQTAVQPQAAGKPLAVVQGGRNLETIKYESG